MFLFCALVLPVVRSFNAQFGESFSYNSTECSSKIRRKFPEKCAPLPLCLITPYRMLDLFECYCHREIKFYLP